MGDPYFEMFQDTTGKWRWRLKAGNGLRIATSGEWFTRREDAVRAARGVQRTAPLATVRVPAARATVRRKTTAQKTALAAALRAVTKTK